jgi:hypothetical protein
MLFDRIIFFVLEFGLILSMYLAKLFELLSNTVGYTAFLTTFLRTSGGGG